MKKTSCWLLLALSLLVAGCTEVPRTPAQQAANLSSPLASAAAVPVQPGDISPPAPGTMRLTVYRGTLDARYLVPEIFEVGKNDHPARTALELLLTPPRSGGMVGLMPEGVALKGVWIKDEVGYVDFSDAVARSAGSTGERLLVAAIVNTLTEFPEITEVQILVEGKRRATLQGHVDITEPLSRTEKLIKH